MNSTLRLIREWAGCAFAIVLVIGASSYALMRGTKVGTDIHALRTAADSLNSSAMQAPATVMDAELIERVATEREALEARMRDSNKQGLVATQLSEEARHAGLQVVEIQPRAGTGEAGIFPRYRVSVMGSYATIGAYMDGCKDQRIPARVVEFAVVPARTPDGEESGLLRADITVEAFNAERLMPDGNDHAPA